MPIPNEFKAQAMEIAQELRAENPDATQDELHEWMQERIHEEADNAVIYYSDAAKIISDAWGDDIDEAEEWLSDCYGEDIYTGCDTFGAVQCRLAYAVTYCGLQDHAYDAVEAVCEDDEDEDDAA